MFTRSILLTACLAGVAAAAPLAPETLPAAPVAAAPARAEPDFAKLVADKSAALVTIKCVLKIDYSGQTQEREEEITGVMIDGKGLVLATNRQMGGVPASMRAVVTVTPTKIKILVGDDTEGVDGKLIARDSDLDLAWIRADKAPEKPYTAVSFQGSPEAKLGDHLLLLDRLPKAFDRVPVVSEMRVGAVIKKPRPELYPAGLLIRYGVPAFNTDLKAVGFVASHVVSEEDTDSGADPQRPELIVVPAAEVVAATERALKTAETNAGAEAKDEAAPAKKDEKKEGEDKK